MFVVNINFWVWRKQILNQDKLDLVDIIIIVVVVDVGVDNFKCRGELREKIESKRSRKNTKDE